MVDVAVAATVTVTAGEVLATKLVSPEYSAVIELSPVGRAVVDQRRDTAGDVAGLPSEVVPLKN